MAKQATVSLTQREVEVLMVCASNYTFKGRRPNPKAMGTAVGKLRIARNRAGMGAWKLKRT